MNLLPLGAALRAGAALAELRGPDASTGLSPLVRRLNSLAALGPDDVITLHKLQGERRRLAAQSELALGDTAQRAALVLHSGWAFRYRRLADGRRQILDIHLPGDILGLPAVLGPRIPCLVRTVTAVEVGLIEPERLAILQEGAPGVARALLALVLADQERLAEHTLCLGRLTAYERMGRLFLDLWRRLEAVGLGGGDRFRLPLTQIELADHLGMTPVHANRTLQQLRRDGLIRLDRHEAILIDPPRLRALAQLG